MLRHLSRETGLDAALDIDLGQLLSLESDVLAQLRAFSGQVGLFGIGLRADRNILSGRHRHGAGNESSDAGDEDAAWFGVGGGHADDQARGRNDAIVGAEDGGSQPADARDEMALRVLV